MTADGAGDRSMVRGSFCSGTENHAMLPGGLTLRSSPVARRFELPSMSRSCFENVAQFVRSSPYFPRMPGISRCAHAAGRRTSTRRWPSHRPTLIVRCDRPNPARSELDVAHGMESAVVVEDVTRLDLMGLNLHRLALPSPSGHRRRAVSECSRIRQSSAQMRSRQAERTEYA